MKKKFAETSFVGGHSAPVNLHRKQARRKLLPSSPTPSPSVPERGVQLPDAQHAPIGVARDGSTDLGADPIESPLASTIEQSDRAPAKRKKRKKSGMGDA